MKKILIFDLADVLIEGFSSFAECLATRLSLAATDVISGLGGAVLVALTEGRISEATYWQCVLERTHCRDLVGMQPDADEKMEQGHATWLLS